MNKIELCAALAEKVDISKKDAEKFVTALTDIVRDTLAEGEDVRIAGFGTYTITDRPERMGRNPKTGEPALIVASKAPKFKASAALKDALNG